MKFFKTSPRRKADASGKGNKDFYTKNNTFKLKINLDCHNPRLKLNYRLLTDPPLFSLLSTFKVRKVLCEEPNSSHNKCKIGLKDLVQRTSCQYDVCVLKEESFER